MELATEMDRRQQAHPKMRLASLVSAIYLFLVNFGSLLPPNDPDRSTRSELRQGEAE